MGCNTTKETLPVGEEANYTKEASNPESAKTVALASNGSIATKSEESELEEAATKIQAAFRGHKLRKSMKQPGKQEEPQPTAQQLEEEFRADDVELCNAATKIQASFRGHMSRKQLDKKDDEESPSEQKLDDEELDIDLSDPDLNKAAIKIQASFRGHLVRKDHENEECNPK